MTACSAGHGWGTAPLPTCVGEAGASSPSWCSSRRVYVGRVTAVCGSGPRPWQWLWEDRAGRDGSAAPAVGILFRVSILCPQNPGHHRSESHVFITSTQFEFVSQDHLDLWKSPRATVSQLFCKDPPTGGWEVLRSRPFSLFCTWAFTQAAFLQQVLQLTALKIIPQSPNFLWKCYSSKFSFLLQNLREINHNI